MSSLTAWLLPVAAGICLSAATGFRAFIPLLAMGIAAHFGVVALDPSHAWLASMTALAVLGTAAIAEVVAYYIPVVDHALDVIATPVAMAAGALVMLASLGADHGVPGWLLALIVGGGVSGAVQLTTVKTRLLSTGTTGGLGNPVVATAELVGSLALSLVALLVPVLAVGAVAVVLVAGVMLVRRRRGAAST